MKQGLDQLNEYSNYFQRLRKDYAELVKIRDDSSKRAKECSEVLKQVDRIDGKDNLDGIIELCDRAELLLKQGLIMDEAYKRDKGAVSKARKRYEAEKEIDIKAIKKRGSFEIPFSENTGWDEDKYILIPRAYRPLFPGFQIFFKVKTDVGDVKTHVVGATAKKGDRLAGNYFTMGMRPWFRHNLPEAGDSLSVKILKLYKEYKIDLKRK